MAPGTPSGPPPACINGSQQKKAAALLPFDDDVVFFFKVIPHINKEEDDDALTLDVSELSPPPVAVISPQFCVGYPLNITILRKVLTHTDFVVTDADANELFKTRAGQFLAVRDRHVLEKVFFSEGRYLVEVAVNHPFVDYAFVVTLLMILEEIHMQGSNN
ncbi:hypothetical protein M569_08720 [Genlisea aurea]|uniref:Uncharacterized protein n=1 Tax=Genlisea aurea TaxID=192259 RepID=S8CGI1_9LAMI|nr:hypothetical protein M569_08720 [Genlisea aurea]